MKNKLLLSSLLSLSILTFSGTAKAQESADATFTGTLSAATEVVKIQDGSATINPTTGDFEGLVAPPIFQVTTSQPAGTDGRLTSAPVSGAPTLAISDELITFIALVNGTPSESAVNNALSNLPNAPDNPDVIAYEITARADGEPNFTFNDGALEGSILAEPGSVNFSAAIGPFARPDTFGPEDSAGNYTANLTLTAVSSL